MLNNMKQLEIVSNIPQKSLNQLRINEGVNLYIEDKTVKYPFNSALQFQSQFEQQNIAIINPESPSPNSSLVIEQTKWEIEFELETNRFTIKFNDPADNTKAQVIAPPTGVTAA